MLVRDKMTIPVITGSRQTTLRDAQLLMVENDVGRLPILDEDKLVGIIAFKDIARSLHSPGVIPEVPVEWIMARNPVTVNANQEIVEAVKLLIEYKIAGLPVMEEGKVVGIITETDILRYMLEILV